MLKHSQCFLRRRLTASKRSIFCTALSVCAVLAVVHIAVSIPYRFVLVARRTIDFNINCVIKMLIWLRVSNLWNVVTLCLTDWKVSRFSCSPKCCNKCLKCKWFCHWTLCFYNTIVSIRVAIKKNKTKK